MKKFIPIIFYLIFSIIVFFPIITGTGIPMGGDWSLPHGKFQTTVYFQYFSNAWNELASYGTRNLALSLYPVVLFMKPLFSIGLSTTQYSNFVLLIIFIFAGSSLYSLLKYFKVGSFAAFLGGIIYVTSPIFFNYSIMGWYFILFFMSSLLPLAIKHFLISLKQKRLRNLLISSIIFSIASIQAQAIVIFPFVFIIVGLFNSKNLYDIKYLLKSLLKMLFVFLLLTAYWLPGMLIIPDQMVVGSDIVSSNISIGTGEHLNPLNIIRTFGSLYNFQFETIINKSNILKLASFALPILVLSSLFIKKRKREVVSFWIIGLVPLLMYFLNNNRSIFSLIPYSNVFRDFSRFTVLSSFAYAVLAGITINALMSNNHKFSKIIIGAILTAWIVSVYPWWHGEITNWQNGEKTDMRLRKYDVNPDYVSIEKYLSSVNPNYKTLYLPTGANISFPSDKKFYGSFNEMQDIFSQYSPIPGSLVINDRNIEDYFINNLRNSLTNNFVDVSSPANYKYIVFRKDAVIDSRESIILNLENNVKNGSLKKVMENSSITLYELTNPFPLIYSIGDDNESKILFIKKNPSYYYVVISNIKDPFNLVFNEHFHSQWKVFIDEPNIFKSWSQSPLIQEDKHSSVNGFSNSWEIDPNEICNKKDACVKKDNGAYDIILRIEFIPQRYFVLGLCVSSITLLSCIVYIVRNKKNPRSSKNRYEK